MVGGGGLTLTLSIIVSLLPVDLLASSVKRTIVVHSSPLLSGTGW